MKRLFATVCNDAFVPGLAVLLHSMRTHVSGFDGIPFKVFWCPRTSALSDEARRRISEVFPSVVFERARNEEAYGSAPKVNDKADNAAYLTLEAFGQQGVDQVLFVDADMLCLADFLDVFRMTRGFGACRAGGYQHWGPTFNTGFFLVNRDILESDCYETLVDAAARNDHTLLRDQALINAYFRRRPVHVLSEHYNCRTFDNLAYVARNIDRIRFLHYSGYSVRPKPWDPGASQSVVGYRLWTEYALDLVDRHPALASLLEPAGLEERRAEIAAIVARAGRFRECLVRDLAPATSRDWTDYDEAARELLLWRTNGVRASIGESSPARRRLYEGLKLMIPVGAFLAMRWVRARMQGRGEPIWISDSPP